MKKIAYCLYGQPRNYKDGFKVIHNLIEKYKNEYEFDFFFHTWFDSTMISNYYDVSSYRHISSDLILINNYYIIPCLIYKIFNHNVKLFYINHTPLSLLSWRDKQITYFKYFNFNLLFEIIEILIKNKK